MSGCKTVLFDSCRARGARFIDFAGWRLPFSFRSPREEHLCARAAGAFFDVSHMGEIRIQGRDSLRLLQKALPTDIAGLKEGRAQYSALLNHQGGLIDDLIAYCLKPGKDYLLCVNAGPKEKLFSQLKAASGEGKFEVSVADESDRWAVIAVQGPKALDLCEKISGLSFSKLKRFCFLEKSGVLFSRTGYTGEDGLELYLPPARAVAAWRRLTEAGKGFGVVPAGLGARDTLRLEAGYLLSGQDFDESRGLKGAGLLRLKKNPEIYRGKGAVPAKDAEGEVLRGFVLEEAANGAPPPAEGGFAQKTKAGASLVKAGRAQEQAGAGGGAEGLAQEQAPPRVGVPRRGALVFSESGESIGVVTSGAKAPSLNQMIGLAYIKENLPNSLKEEEKAIVCAGASEYKSKESGKPASGAAAGGDKNEEAAAAPPQTSPGGGGDPAGSGAQTADGALAEGSEKPVNEAARKRLRRVLIEIHGEKHPAKLVKPPFVKGS